MCTYVVFRIHVIKYKVEGGSNSALACSSHQYRKLRVRSLLLGIADVSGEALIAILNTEMGVACGV
jgi:hypothetical protein